MGADELLDLRSDGSCSLTQDRQVRAGELDLRAVDGSVVAAHGPYEPEGLKNPMVRCFAKLSCSDPIPADRLAARARLDSDVRTALADGLPAEEVAKIVARTLREGGMLATADQVITQPEQNVRSSLVSA
jgi:hypothetical protein